MGDPPFLYVQPTPRRLLSPPPLPSSAASNSNLPMLYYGIFVVGTAIIVLAVYNLIIIKYCSDHPHDGPSRRQEPTSTRSIIGLRASSITSFKYSKKGAEQDKDQGNNDNECVVCLSVFEEGEEIRKLIGCKHSFHAACIDMWLHSHSECPLCRSPVERPAVIDSQLENSREGLIHEGIV